MEINKQILGMKGICQDCEKEGIWCYEPYELEIHDKEVLICLCENCRHERFECV